MELYFMKLGKYFSDVGVSRAPRTLALSGSSGVSPPLPALSV